MNLCDDNHDEICFEGRNCPCCELKLQLESEEEKSASLNERIDSLKDEVSELKSEVQTLASQIE